MSPAPDVTYPPLDVLKRVDEEIWIVDSGPFPVLPGLAIPVRMTVIRLASGDMWLHSPTRCNPDLRQSIEKLGPICHILASNIAHWSFMADWQAACPNVLCWAAPGLASRHAVRKAQLRIDRELETVPPPDWSEVIDQVAIHGAWEANEVAFFHKPTRTLILTDLIENFEGEKLPTLWRPLMRMLRTVAPGGSTPLHFRLLLNLNRSHMRRAAQQLLGWQPQRVTFAHGLWFQEDGAVKLRQALEWLTK